MCLKTDSRTASDSSGVVGAEIVDKWLQDSDESTRPLEELITEFGWGAIWSRPGSPRKTRSLLTLALSQH